MNKKSAITLIIILIVGIAIQYFKLSTYILSHNLLSNITTFLSIVFGFYITSLAVFASSRYVASLYKIEDSSNPGTTLLHTLIKNYKSGLMLALFSIMYFLAIEIFLMRSSSTEITYNNIWALPFIGILVSNFYYSYIMLTDLLRVILQEAKRSK